MSIILDTNACIASMDGDAMFRARMKPRLLAGEQIFLPVISLFELHYGVANSSRRDQNATRLADFMRAAQVLPFDHEDALTAARLRLRQKQRGRTLQAYDLLIAAQAIRRDWLLVTADRDFTRIDGLRLENWAA